MPKGSRGGRHKNIVTAPTDHKQAQLDIILEANPAEDDIHTWIRTKDDILTYEEALDYDGMTVDDDLTNDFTAEDLQKAMRTGKVTVYSSKPIQAGNFVTPSRQEAQSYAGSGQIYSREVDLKDVAWIDSLQGQYARV